MGEVDPRFEPEFQRGYDPAVHGRSRPPRRSRIDPGPAVVPPREVEDDVEGAVEADIEAEETWAAPMRRNPFLVVLPILGVLLLGTCAFVMFRWTGAYGRIFDGPGQIGDNEWMTGGSAVSPALLVGGLLCFTLWLTILSLNTRRPDA